MPIKITKKNGVVQTQRAVVKTVNVIEEAPPPAVRSAAQVKDDWVKHMPIPNAKVQTCQFCEKHYIKPCKGAEHTGCMNWQFKMGKVKETA